MNDLAHIGVIGLGTMGANLARNFASRGYRVAVINRSSEKTEQFMVDYHEEGHFVANTELKQFIASLERPRKIMLMVKAGDAVDDVIEDLYPHLEKGDIIIDGGNSLYVHTQDRFSHLKEEGIHFMGVGVSGGEEGALHGPSMMPGGSKQAWRSLKSLFESVAAKDFSGNPCVAYIGNGGAGHYVKMVHNGIEYGIMQAMAEMYDLLTSVYGFSAAQVSDMFAALNKGMLKSFLFDIAIDVLYKKDDIKGKRGFLVDKILDKASQKGTGKWTSQDALDRGIAIPGISEAVFARVASSFKDLRTTLAKQYPIKKGKKAIPKKELESVLRSAMEGVFISLFAQGFHLIQEASAEEKWAVNLSDVARIWQGGCIIRCGMLKEFAAEFANQLDAHVLELAGFVAKSKKGQKGLAAIVGGFAGSGVPMPVFATSLYYMEALTRERLPANFIQGLRDFFGAHTYERVDTKGTHHTKW